MRENTTYSNAIMNRIVEFKDIYPEIKTYPTIESLLENFYRKDLIKLSQTLTNLYKDAEIHTMQNFFNSESVTLKKDFNNRFNKIAKSNTKYIFCTIQTCTEFLKFTFSISNKPIKLTTEEFEEKILKAILIINESLTSFKRKTKNQDNKLELAELLVVNSFSQKDINNFDYNKTFREYLTKSLDLFEYISTDTYFNPIYKEFTRRLKISNYKEYIITILGLFTIMYEYAQNTKETTSFEQWAGRFIYDSHKDPDKLFKTTILDYMSMQWDEIIPLKENLDYKVFREKPLIKYSDSSYEIQNPGFVIEKLFFSLYFDFRNIAKDLNLKNFNNEYKENFGEKYLLSKYIQLSNSLSRYNALSSKDCKLISLEGGEPDYYLRNKSNSVILFENKDILISAGIKQERDFEKIINEYKNKLLLKTQSNGKLVKKPKAEGIGQLVSQIKKIQEGCAFWDKTVPKESLIYPVLVISDSKLLPDGLAYLMQDWYKNDCKAKNINTKNAKPLILLSISTLLLYSTEFQEDGFEYYFERYYDSIKEIKLTKNNSPLLNIYNLCVTFSDYMENVYPKDFQDIYDSYREKLFC